MSYFLFCRSYKRCGYHFTNGRLLGEKNFIFLDNYAALFQDHQFWVSLGFTLKYALFVTPCLFVFAFILALLINGAFAGVNFFRSLYFAPVVISMACCSMVWLWIYNDLYGVLNYILETTGIIDDPILWMNSGEDVASGHYLYDYMEDVGIYHADYSGGFSERG